MAGATEMYDYVTDRLTDFYLAYYDRMFAAAPGRIDILRIADDVAMQDGLLFSPRDFDRQVAPRLRKLIEMGHRHGAKVMLDVETFPGQVPYRAILPQGVDNLLVPVCLSSTHVAWGAIRLEPTWMNLCEPAGHAAALAVKHKMATSQLDPDLLLRKLATSHVMLSFFNDIDVSSDDARVAAAQYFATKGFFARYDAKLDAPLTEAVKAAWQQGLDKLQSGALDPMLLARAVHDAEAQTSPDTEQKRGDFLQARFDRLPQLR